MKRSIEATTQIGPVFFFKQRIECLITFMRHWPEYFMEVAGLGIFVVSACTFGTILEYPASPVHQAIADPFLRRILMGLAMGLTTGGGALPAAERSPTGDLC